MKKNIIFNIMIMIIVMILMVTIHAAPIHDAVRNNDIKEIRLLLEKPFNINLKLPCGWSPLHIAAIV